MTDTNRGPMNRLRTAVLLAAFALSAAACGGHLTDAEIIAASGVGSSAGDSASVGSPVTPGTAEDGPGTVPLGPAGDPGSLSSGGSSVSQPSAGGVAGPGADPASASVTTRERGPIVVASVGNYSGPAGASLQGLPRAVQAWAAHVNSRGGLFGREVQVIVQDDGGDPARYASAVRDLVENRGVIAFIANGAPLSMAGGESYLEAKGIPVIGSDCALQAWFEGPVYFPACTEYNDTIVNVMRAGREVSGRKSFGYLYCTEAAACTGQVPLFRAGARSAGVDIVYEGGVSLTQVDFTGQCRNAQAAGVDLFYVGAESNTVARVVRSCDRQGFHPQYIQVAMTALGNTNQLPGIGDVIVSSMFFPFAGSSSPAAKEFATVMATFVGTAPDPGDALGWASAKLFETIATSAARATGSLTSATLLGAARQVSGETLGGLTTELTFTSGVPTPRNCWFAVQSKRGTWADVTEGPRCV